MNNITNKYVIHILEKNKELELENKELELENKELELENKELKLENNSLQDDIKTFDLKFKNNESKILCSSDSEYDEELDTDIEQKDEEYNEEFKIIQEYYNLLQKEWVQYLCNEYLNITQDPRCNHNYIENNYTKNKIKFYIIQNEWFYKDRENNLNKIKIHDDNGFSCISLNIHCYIISNITRCMSFIYNWEKNKYKSLNIRCNEWKHNITLFTSYLSVKLMNKT